MNRSKTTLKVFIQTHFRFKESFMQYMINAFLRYVYSLCLSVLSVVVTVGCPERSSSVKCIQIQVFKYSTISKFFHFYENTDIHWHKRLFHNIWKSEMAQMFRSIFQIMYNRSTGEARNMNTIFMLSLNTSQPTLLHQPLICKHN